jgi:hypothetical protein
MRNAMRAWERAHRLIESYRAGVPGISRLAVEEAIDTWLVMCERLIPPQQKFLIVKRKGTP